MADKYISKINIENELYLLKDSSAARAEELKALSDKLNAFLDAEGLADEALDTLIEIQKFITDEASAADQLVEDVNTLKEANNWFILNCGTSTEVI